MKLYTKIPLTNENIFRLGGSMAAAFGATILRAFMQMEDLSSDNEDIGVE